MGIMKISRLCTVDFYLRKKKIFYLRAQQLSLKNKMTKPNKKRNTLPKPQNEKNKAVVSVCVVLRNPKQSGI